MPFYEKDTETGKYYVCSYQCIDNGEDPVKKGYTIFNVWLNKSRTRQKLIATDHNGIDHEIKLIRKEYSEPSKK